MIASSISATTRSASPFSTEHTVFIDEYPRLEDLEKCFLISEVGDNTKTLISQEAFPSFFLLVQGTTCYYESYCKGMNHPG